MYIIIVYVMTYRLKKRKPGVRPVSFWQCQLCMCRYQFCEILLKVLGDRGSTVARCATNRKVTGSIPDGVIGIFF